MKNFKFALLALFCLGSTPAFAGNFHVVEENPETGYGIYRTGKPSLKDFKALCARGVTKMIVMSGNGSIERGFAQKYCPTMEVVYDEAQRVKIPVSKEFLAMFDSVIAEAKLKGEKVAFRCNCGCHRTGRLAAYYQMKYQKLTVDDAIAIMNKHGKVMFFFPMLPDQVQALNDYIHGRPCSVAAKNCVRETEPSKAELAAIPEDDVDSLAEAQTGSMNSTP